MKEWLHLLLSLGAYAAYEFYVRWIMRRSPMRTARSAHAAIRADWVRAVMQRPGNEVLVIQTLRNSVMASSFMATTAMVALSGTLSLSGIANSENRILQSLRSGNEQDLMFALILLLLAGSFFISFLLQAMAVRYFNHVGYLITAGTSPEQAASKQTAAIHYLNRAGNYYSLGLRAFFLCIPFLAGLFGTVFMLPAVLVLLIVLYRFDRVGLDEA